LLPTSQFISWSLCEDWLIGWEKKIFSDKLLFSLLYNERILNWQFQFEQEELKSLQGLQPASRCCKEYVSFTITWHSFKCSKKIYAQVIDSVQLAANWNIFLQGHWLCCGKLRSFDSYVRTVSSVKLCFLVLKKNNSFMHLSFHFLSSFFILTRSRKKRRTCLFWKWLWYCFLVHFSYFSV
jgi:hypothetical protein